jgi:hypothetical protein
MCIAYFNEEVSSFFLVLSCRFYLTFGVDQTLYIYLLQWNDREKRIVPEKWNDSVFAWCQTMYNARIKAKESSYVTPRETLSFSLNRVIAGRAVRMLAAVAGTIGLLYLVALVPGAIVIALPGVVVATSKVYDEARLIHFLKYGDPINPGIWEQVEVSNEMALIKASAERDVSKQFTR